MSSDPSFHFPNSLLRSIESVCQIDKPLLQKAHEAAPSVSVRINPKKQVKEFSSSEQVPWCSEAFYLPERISFVKDPLFHAGCYYVQEASSMFLESVIKQTVELSEDIRVLDLCASPGGKSTLINSLLNENSLLVSNEVIKTRVGALCENLSKWGRANVVVSNNDPKEIGLLTSYFDLIVVDAPCSGSGLFRKQQDAIDHWSQENVLHCAQRQQRILSDILPALKPGGTLIYSTCSYSPEENEEIVKWLIHDMGLAGQALQNKPEWGITETGAEENGWGYRFFPHLTKGEGFFISAFKKATGDANEVYPSKKYVQEKIQKDEYAQIERFVNTTNSQRIIKQKENYFLVNQAIEEDLPLLLEYLSVRKKGTLLGELKGKDFVPHHELALSIHLNTDVVSAEVDEETALRFLKKSDFKLDSACPKGFCIINYKTHPLGWVKNLGNRINNYLPKEWRILMDIHS